MKPRFKWVIAVFLTITIADKMNAQYWEPLGGGVKGFGNILSLSMDTFHNKLFVGGIFDSIGMIKEKNLAAWDGNQWHALPNTPSLPIADLVMKKDTLVYITKVNNDSQVGMYVDSSFIGVLSPVGNSATCIYVFKDTIYAGGEFSGGIKYWNGTEWKKVGGGIDGSLDRVETIGEYQGQLIVGGHFSLAGSVEVNNIAVWDGSEWHALGEGITGAFPKVFAVQEFNDELYVGGYFQYAGGVSAVGICKWNSSEWSSVIFSDFGDGCGSVHDMFVEDSLLYVAGEISGYDGCLGGRAAVFDGQYWYNLHLAEDGYAWAIRVFNSDIIAGTSFANVVNGDTVNYVGHYIGSIPTTNLVINLPSMVPLFPNPVNDHLFISSSYPTTLSIFNLFGEKVTEEKASGEEIIIDVSELPPGIYLVRDEKKVIGKFVKR